jgi:hypothetical protein
MKKRTWLVARIIGVLLAAVPAARADRPNVLLKPEGKPDAGGQLQLNRDQKIAIICQTLKDMGREDVAGDLQRDYASGVVRLDTFSDRGTTAYTQKNGITLNDGALGVEIMQSPRDNRTMAFGCGVSGALTVLHEYIHLRQSQERAKTILNPFDSSANPDQIPEWENKAWTGTIMEANQWVAKITREVEQIGPGFTFEARADKLALALKYLRELNTSCGSLANGLTGAEGEIAAGHVTAASAFGGRTQEDLTATLGAMQQRVNGGLARVRIDLAGVVETLTERELSRQDRSGAELAAAREELQRLAQRTAAEKERRLKDPNWRKSDPLQSQLDKFAEQHESLKNDKIVGGGYALGLNPRWTAQDEKKFKDLEKQMAKLVKQIEANSRDPYAAEKAELSKKITELGERSAILQASITLSLWNKYDPDEAKLFRNKNATLLAKAAALDPKSTGDPARR